MMFDAPTNKGEHVTSNVACDVKMTLCIMTLCNFLPFLGQNVISDGPTNGLSNVNTLIDDLFLTNNIRGKKHRHVVVNNLFVGQINVLTECLK